jgi:copper chaperone NosL
MNVSVEKNSRYLNTPLDLPVRGFLLVAALLMIASCFLPLWRIDVGTPSDPQRLGLAMYANRLETVGWLANDVEVRSDDSPDSRWLPFVVGGLALLLLRGAAIGTERSLVDLFVLFVYFVGFSIWSFAGRLDFYGRYIAAETGQGVSLFVPPLFGHERLGTLDVTSFPSFGSFTIAAAGFALAAALVVSWKAVRSEIASEVRLAA